ncbi:hypothetical protein COT72_02695 [archaeon CG10_big_fil_rev_8_21_14_0_10_43_11]|nr:MAG: hypothetical protein COT72_02695 [archaeon CG10_big_fil_rev_8_21_14_0_10_43_11]
MLKAPLFGRNYAKHYNTFIRPAKNIDQFARDVILGAQNPLVPDYLPEVRNAVFKTLHTFGEVIVHDPQNKKRFFLRGFVHFQKTIESFPTITETWGYEGKLDMLLIQNPNQEKVSKNYVVFVPEDAVRIFGKFGVIGPFEAIENCSDIINDHYIIFSPSPVFEEETITSFIDVEPGVPEIIDTLKEFIFAESSAVPERFVLHSLGYESIKQVRGLNGVSLVDTTKSDTYEIESVAKLLDSVSPYRLLPISNSYTSFDPFTTKTLPHQFNPLLRDVSVTQFRNEYSPISYLIINPSNKKESVELSTHILASGNVDLLNAPVGHESLFPYEKRFDTLTGNTIRLSLLRAKLFGGVYYTKRDVLNANPRNLRLATAEVRTHHDDTPRRLSPGHLRAAKSIFDESRSNFRMYVQEEVTE